MRVNCATCGSENASQLTFCQDCGQRLGPRVAPPTPPVGLSPPAGMPRIEMSTARPPPHALGSAFGAPGTSGISDLSATVPSAGTERPPPLAMHSSPANANAGDAVAPLPPPTIGCPYCGARCHLGMRFCVTCGRSLASAAGAGPASSPPVVSSAPVALSGAAPSYPQQPAPSYSQQASAPLPASSGHGPAQPSSASPSTPIAPTPMIELRAAEPPATTSRACPRCRGTNEGNAPYCKFCGASLGDPSGLKRALGESPRPTPSPWPSAASRGAAVAAVPPAYPLPYAAPPPPTAAAPAPHYAPAPPIAAAAPAPIPSPSPLVAAPAVVARSPYPTPRQSPQVVLPASSNAVAAAPIAAKPARLVLIAKDGSEGQSFVLAPTTASLDIGRTEGDAVLPDDPFVSPRHARIARARSGGSGFTLRDLGSTNGVYMRLDAGPSDIDVSAPLRAGEAMSVRGASQKPSGLHDGVDSAAPLTDQDLFLVGQQVIRFEFVNDAEEGFGSASEHGTLLFGTPAAPRFARLSQRTVEGVVRDVFYIRKTETVLGREIGDIVFTDDPFLSRRHAVIRMDKERKRVSLTDLGSSNGTFLKIRGEVPLKTGDQFRIGQQLFRFDAGGNALPNAPNAMGSAPQDRT